MKVLIQIQGVTRHTEHNRATLSIDNIWKVTALLISPNPTPPLPV